MGHEKAIFGFRPWSDTNWVVQHAGRKLVISDSWSWVILSTTNVNVIWRGFFFAYAKTKVQISCAVTVQLISTFVFATWIVQFPYFLNPNFLASSYLLSLHKPGLCQTWSEIPRTIFLMMWLICSDIVNVLISWAVTAQLISAFVSEYAKSRVSHDAGHIWSRPGGVDLSAVRPTRHQDWLPCLAQFFMKILAEYPYWKWPVKFQCKNSPTFQWYFSEISVAFHWNVSDIHRIFFVGMAIFPIFFILERQISVELLVENKKSRLIFTWFFRNKVAI